MNRETEINNFLVYASKILKKNPNINLTVDSIYSLLMEYGYSEDEFKESEKVNIFHIQDRLNNQSIIHNYEVKYDFRSPFFLQVMNDSKDKFNERIKLFLSFKASDLEKCSSIIFNFIGSNNYKHFSKIADRVRSDDITISVNDVETAEAIINFVNSDPTLSSCIKKSNPFMWRIGNVGIAFERYISYNRYTAYLITKYLNNKKDNLYLDAVNYADFKVFLNSYHFKTFNTLENLDTLRDAPEYYSTIELEKGKTILDHYQVSKLLLKSLDEKFDLNGFEEFFRSVTNKNTNSELISYYDSVIKNRNLAIKEQEEKDRTEELLNTFIEYCLSKKKSINEIEIILSRFSLGDDKAITKYGNFRQNFVRYVDRNKILSILESKKKAINGNREISIEEQYILFLRACASTSHKYSIEQLRGALLYVKQNKNFNCFTNDGDNQYRNRLNSLVEIDKIDEFMNRFLNEHNEVSIYKNDIIGNFALAVGKYYQEIIDLEDKTKGIN